MQTYVGILRKHEIKVTQQRLAILRYLDQDHTHPTADQIYCALKPSHPSLSKTTVYNTLDLFHQYGLVEELTITKSETRYDYGKGLHHHFLCNRCGRVLDLDLEVSFLDSIDGVEHKIEEVHGYFKGVCVSCLAALDGS